ARAAREHPVLLNRLRDGSLHLSGIAKLVPHLTLENREAVLARAAHRSKRAIEELIAELAPRPDVPTAVRVLPQRPAARPLSALRAKAPSLELRPGGVTSQAAPAAAVAVSAVPTLPATVQPLAPARYKIQFTASAELVQKLERLKGLMRSSVPDGDLAA